MGTRKGPSQHTIKSLGAQAKSGSAPVQGVMQRVGLGSRQSGGSISPNTPGYDQLSVPALVGSGCQVVCFTTAVRASETPSRLLSRSRPTQRSYRRMHADMDIDAGLVIPADGSSSQPRRNGPAYLRPHP